MIYWLEYLQLNDGCIVPIRSITEEGENRFGGGSAGVLFDGKHIDIVLTSFETMEGRSDYIKKYISRDYDIKSVANFPGFFPVKEWKPLDNGRIIGDVVYMIDGVPVGNMI